MCVKQEHINAAIDGDLSSFFPRVRLSTTTTTPSSMDNFQVVHLFTFPCHRCAIGTGRHCTQSTAPSGSRKKCDGCRFAKVACHFDVAPRLSNRTMLFDPATREWREHDGQPRHAPVQGGSETASESEIKVSDGQRSSKLRK